MKYLLVFFLLAPLTLSAQFLKGTLGIGGNISYSSQLNHGNNISDNKNSTLNVRPRAELFLSNTFSLGAYVSLSKFKTMHSIPSTNLYYDADYNSQTYGVLARKYISISDNFLFSLERGVLE
jgi:hypothetical protein